MVPDLVVGEETAVALSALLQADVTRQSKAARRITPTRPVHLKLIDDGLLETSVLRMTCRVSLVLALRARFARALMELSLFEVQVFVFAVAWKCRRFNIGYRVPSILFCAVMPSYLLWRVQLRER